MRLPSRRDDADADGQPGRVGSALTGRTAWARNLQTPLRTFLRTETGSAAFLLAAVVAALVWATADADSYTRVWERTYLAIHIGDAGISHTLRYWVNSGLEARREFDMGELRERRRAALPVAAGTAGMLALALVGRRFPSACGR